jgi:hypothetical protein
MIGLIDSAHVRIDFLQKIVPHIIVGDGVIPVVGTPGIDPLFPFFLKGIVLLEFRREFREIVDPFKRFSLTAKADNLLPFSPRQGNPTMAIRPTPLQCPGRAPGRTTPYRPGNGVPRIERQRRDPRRRFEPLLAHGGPEPRFHACPQAFGPRVELPAAYQAPTAPRAQLANGPPGTSAIRCLASSTLPDPNAPIVIVRPPSISSRRPYVRSPPRQSCVTISTSSICAKAYAYRRTGRVGDRARGPVETHSLLYPAGGGHGEQAR